MMFSDIKYKNALHFMSISNEFVFYTYIKWAKVSSGGDISLK